MLCFVVLAFLDASVFAQQQSPQPATAVAPASTPAAPTPAQPMLSHVNKELPVWLRFSGHGAESEVPIEMELAHVITMRDGKWARTVEYAAKAEALEAAGLRE